MDTAAPTATAAAPLVLAIGQFDGVHRGHQAVFRATVEEARRHNGVAGCLTFWPHVAQLLNPARAPLLLATPEQNRAWMTACGITQIHTLPFTRELAATGPGDFLVMLKQQFPQLVGLVVGENFTCGKNRAGNIATLPALAAAQQLAIRFVPHVELAGAPISSTRIRAAVAVGDLPLAKAMLGRSFSLTGIVIHGRAVGRKLGFPTADIHPHLPIRPQPGIYAARLLLPEGPRPGAAFVPDAHDPAQAHFGSVVEIHLPDYTGNLYGQTVEIAFTRRLRGHQVFADADAAAAQIARDTTAALIADAEENT